MEWRGGGVGGEGVGAGGEGKAVFLVLIRETEAIGLGNRPLKRLCEAPPSPIPPSPTSPPFLPLSPPPPFPLPLPPLPTQSYFPAAAGLNIHYAVCGAHVFNSMLVIY